MCPAKIVNTRVHNLRVGKTQIEFSIILQIPLGITRTECHTGQKKAFSSIITGFLMSGSNERMINRKTGSDGIANRPE